MKYIDANECHNIENADKLAQSDIKTVFEAVEKDDYGFCCKEQHLFRGYFLLDQQSPVKWIMMAVENALESAK